MLLTLYRGLTTLAGPFVPLLLAQREKAGKEDPSRRGERLGTSPLDRPPGRLVWAHGASIGEAQSIMTLIQRLTANDPDLHILLTTGTVTSAQVLANRMPTRTVHQFVPLDRPSYVHRFLDSWRPDMALWVESDLWPNMLSEVRRRRIPAALVNARLSDRSFRRWRRFPNTARRLLSTFRLILPWDEEQATRFHTLGAGWLGPAGNVKFSADPPNADPQDLIALSSAIASRPAWLAASTHDGEEEAVIAVHKALAVDHPDLLTIIAPRHPERAPGIGAQLDRSGLSWAQRSTGSLPDLASQVYLADTVGEMGLLLRAVRIAFIGGSLVPIGGHNPIEAALLDAAILYGPHMANFRDIAGQLEHAGGAQPVADSEQLTLALRRFLTDPDAARGASRAARTVVDRNRGIVDRAIEALSPLLEESVEHQAAGAPGGGGP